MGPILQTIIKLFFKYEPEMGFFINFSQAIRILQVPQWLIVNGICVLWTCNKRLRRKEKEFQQGCISPP